MELNNFGNIYYTRRYGRTCVIFRNHKSIARSTPAQKKHRAIIRDVNKLLKNEDFNRYFRTLANEQKTTIRKVAYQYLSTF